MEAEAKANDTARKMAEDGVSEAELITDIVQVGLDIGGIIEPTPFCDIASGIISGARGEWWSVGISVASLVPWVGDLAKLGKLPDLFKIVTKVGNYALENAKFADEIKPILREIRKATDVFLEPGGISRAFPDEAKQIVKKIRDKLDEVLNPKRIRETKRRLIVDSSQGSADKTRHAMETGDEAADTIRETGESLENTQRQWWKDQKDFLKGDD